MEDVMKRMLCIRSKMMIPVLVVLVVSAGAALLLIWRMEERMSSSNHATRSGVSYNYMAGVTLTGDLYSNYLLNKEFPKEFPQMTSVHLSLDSNTALHRLRNNIAMVFGFSLILGVFLTVVTSRSISRPIMQLVDASKELQNHKLGSDALHPKCRELQMLSNSFKSMQEGLVEYEEEKSRLESVEITKNLAAGIAHEIKNPINTVGLIADYLQTNLSPDEPEKRYEFFKLSENMKNELKRINRIVEGFLRLTKPDVYTFRNENVNSIIQYNVSTLEPELVRHGIKVLLNYHSSLPLIKADRDRLNQVFSNLIINAIEAMPRGGQIDITTNLQNGNVEINVADDGIGIEEENLRKIFSPYYSTKNKGFGLGLSLIHSIVHKHQGKISVHSEKGKGTRFTILLPVEFSDE
jgi:signal transduction histidine kinase